MDKSFTDWDNKVVICTNHQKMTLVNDIFHPTQ